MKLLKVILFFFAIYFIRRFIQLYKTMKNIQESQARQESQNNNSRPGPSAPKENIVNADFRVLD